MISSTLNKSIFTLICILISFNTFANSFIENADTTLPDDMPPLANPEVDDAPAFAIDEVYNIVEKMPALKECENLEDTEKRHRCTEEQLKEYLASNLKYPLLAKERETEGTVIIQCRIDRNGRVFDARVLKDIGDGCGREALRVINHMNKNGSMWTAGIHRNKKVLVELNIPVHFELTPKQEEVFEVSEVMPTLNDCKNFKTSKGKTNCTNSILLDYMYENIQYPNQAIDNDIEGEVIVKWTVSKAGEIIDISPVSKIGGGCEEEVVRLIKEMEKNGLKWNPGTQNNKNVNVEYRIPVRFTITKALKKKRKKELKRSK